jgi:preprotein translocase subunit SecD
MSLRVRLAVITAVVALSVWMIHPPGDRLQLGLDLRGGVQLILHVQTEDALRLETARAAERLRVALAAYHATFSRVEVRSPHEFVVEGLTREADLRPVATEIDPRFDRTHAPGRAVFRVKPDAEARIRDETVESALRTIERRVNALGVTEPVVARYSDRDDLLVELPGMSDLERARKIISTTAQVALTLAERGPFSTREAAIAAYGSAFPSDLEVLPGPSGGAEPQDAYWVLQRSPAATGTDIRNPRQSFDEFNRPAVAFTLSPDAARRFGQFTAQHIGKSLATVLDDRVMSVATIVSRIDAEGQIVGLSREEVLEQLITLRSGALPADLEYRSQQAIGPSLGADSVRAGLQASLVGLLLVSVLVLYYFRLTGMNALVSVVLNLLILLAVAAYIPVTLTLPGIAGLVLTIGMGVDSNVLIFERMREELALGRTPRAAMHAGFTRVWVTIVDTHVASLLAAACLYQFGTSSIRGFATMLALGLAANVFTAVFVSRTLFELSLRWRKSTPAGSAGRDLDTQDPAMAKTTTTA